MNHCPTKQEKDLPFHQVVDLGWVGLTFLPICQADSTQADSGRQWNNQKASQRNPVHEQMNHPVFGKALSSCGFHLQVKGYLVDIDSSPAHARALLWWVKGPPKRGFLLIGDFLRKGRIRALRFVRGFISPTGGIAKRKQLVRKSCGKKLFH